MRVALNSINNKSSMPNNPNQVNFKAKAELRLSEAFFGKLAKLKPEKAAEQIQNIIDATTFLRKIAPKIGKRDELVILTEQAHDIRWVNLFYYRRFGINTMRETEPGKRLYYKEWITPVLVDDGSKPVRQMTDTFNNEHNIEKGIVLKDGKKLPKREEKNMWYTGFIASEDGMTLTRQKLSYAGFSATQLATPNTPPKVLKTEKTTLTELMAKLKALCTPVEQQKKLACCGWAK